MGYHIFIWGSMKRAEYFLLMRGELLLVYLRISVNVIGSTYVND